MQLVFPIHDVSVTPKRVNDFTIRSVEMLYDKISVFEIKGFISYPVRDDIINSELAHISFIVPNNIKVIVGAANKNANAGKYLKAIVSSKRNVLTKNTTIDVQIFAEIANIKKPDNIVFTKKDINSTFTILFKADTVLE